MLFRRTWLLAALIVAMLLARPGRMLAEEAPDSPDASRRQEIETIIREYLLAHPEVIADAIQELERREQEAQRKRATETVRAHLTELTQDPESPVGGNPGGSVTIVEFFDYQCGHCKREAIEIQKLLQSDTDIRLVYKELPILGPTSVFAARAVLAGRKQGKYETLHAALMATTERLTEQLVLQVAAEAGLDIPQLEQDMEDPSVAAALDRNFQLQRSLHIQGTPALVVGTEFVVGAIVLNALRELVGRTRQK